MSEPPEGERLVEYLVALTRLENPGAPSLRESVAGTLGVDYETMLNAPGEYDEALGMTYAQAADVVHETSLELVETLAEHDFDVPESEREAGPDVEVNMNLLVVDLETIGNGEPNRVPTTTCATSSRTSAKRRNRASRGRGRGSAHRGRPRESTCRPEDRVPHARRRRPATHGAELLHAGPAEGAGQASVASREGGGGGVLERHYSENGDYPEEIGVVAWGPQPCAPAARPSRRCSR